jgi:hypothetical protein
MTIKIDGGHGAKSAFAHPTICATAVIVSEAKQSIADEEKKEWIASSLRFSQ